MTHSTRLLVFLLLPLTFLSPLSPAQSIFLTALPGNQTTLPSSRFRAEDFSLALRAYFFHCRNFGWDSWFLLPFFYWAHQFPFTFILFAFCTPLLWQFERKSLSWDRSFGFWYRWSFSQWISIWISVHLWALRSLFLFIELFQLLLPEMLPCLPVITSWYSVLQW